MLVRFHMLFAHAANRIALKVIVNIYEVIPTAFLLVKFGNYGSSYLVA